MDEAETIAGLMALSAICPDVQIVQTRFRLQLARGWGIPEGANVLEIGCGQGDMTAVLAHLVGPAGRVTALDAAHPDYGGPVTVGRSSEHLGQTELGPRIDFHYEYDLLDEANDFPPDTFDVVVFAHCAWYFGSIDQLRRTLARVRPWAKRLCFSEWDPEPRSLDQVPHLLAVLIQGQVEAHQPESEANVRSPFSKTELLALLRETGWSPTSDETIDSSPLQDGAWEIDRCLHQTLEEAQALDLPPKLWQFLQTQADILTRLVEGRTTRSLASYSIMAETLVQKSIAN